MATSLRKTLFSNALLAAAALGLGSGLANAQTVGLLSMVKGDVQITRAGQSAPAPAKIADLLAAGDRVLTGANGEATFLFCPESRAGKLLPGGEAEFTAAALQVKKGKLGDERKVPNCKLPAALLAQIAPKVVRTRVAGIDVIAYRTAVEQIVTLRGSLPAGDAFCPPENPAIAKIGRAHV